MTIVGVAERGFDAADQGVLALAIQIRSFGKPRMHDFRRTSSFSLDVWSGITVARASRPQL